MSQLRARSSHSARGFTLIEVLIALLVLAIGMLGIAGLQTMSLRAAQEAQFGSIASVTAQSLGELIALRGSYVAADRNELLDELGGVLPGAAIDVESVDSGTASVDRFAIDVAWDGRDDERVSLRYLVSAPQ